MPEYRWKCKKCNKVVDEFLKTIIDDDMMKKCTCGSFMDHIINFQGGFDLKGAGFYQNDYGMADKCNKHGRDDV